MHVSLFLLVSLVQFSRKSMSSNLCSLITRNPTFPKTLCPKADLCVTHVPLQFYRPSKPEGILEITRPLPGGREVTCKGHLPRFPGWARAELRSGPVRPLCSQCSFQGSFNTDSSHSWPFQLGLYEKARCRHDNPPKEATCTFPGVEDTKGQLQ